MNLLRRITVGVALAALSVTSLAACSGDGDDKPSANTSADSDDDGKTSPEEVMAFAKAELDATSGVRLSLSTADEREDGDFLQRAEGVITNAPAFEGTADGRFLGFQAKDVEIRSVDGDFYVNAPIIGWDTYDPAELCAPDPALLLDPDTGVSNVLTAAEDLDEGEPRRAEDDNDVIVTPYTATVPGDAITNILPCAPGDTFDATFTFTGDGLLRAAELTGEFFSGGDDITYTIAITEYDVEQDITAP